MEYVLVGSDQYGTVSVCCFSSILTNLYTCYSSMFGSQKRASVCLCSDDVESCSVGSFTVHLHFAPSMLQGQSSLTHLTHNTSRLFPLRFFILALHGFVPRA